MGLSTGAAYWLPPKYKSSITILVEQAATLNPMVRFNLAVVLASEDRLKSFNEIIYSRSTMNVLIDSLDLAPKGISMKQRQELINRVRENITTNLRASDSFSITYFDTDPKRAKKAVTLLSNYFIKTKIRFENKRNSQTVEFFKKKLIELQRLVEQREKEMSRMIEENVRETPRENRSLQFELENIAERKNEITMNIRDIQRRLEVVKAINSGKDNLEALYQLDLSAMASGDQLQVLLNSYEEYALKYTSSYPEVQELEQKIHGLIGQIITEAEAKLFNQQAQRSFLERQYEELTARIQQIALSSRQAAQTQLDMDVYRGLYNEMKVKLEQAKTTLDLGKNAKEHFIVIDPPIIPREPAKPNRVLLVGGGLGLGLFLGFMAAAVAELLDTTIRSPRDLEKYEKPVVAFISERQN